MIEKLGIHEIAIALWIVWGKKKILVVVSGEDKASILQKVICGPVTPQVPASILQLHGDVTIVADEAALSKM